MQAHNFLAFLMSNYVVYHNTKRQNKTINVFILKWPSIVALLDAVCVIIIYYYYENFITYSWVNTYVQQLQSTRKWKVSKHI